MSNSLFSVFEPSAWAGLPLNWLSLGVLVILPSGYVLSPFKFKLSMTWLEGLLAQTVKESWAKNSTPVSSLMVSSLMIWVLINNFMGLAPYYFTASAHLVFGFALGLSIWVGFMMTYVFYFNQDFMSHLIPQGTPSGLVVLMILIETTSNLIRPLTLMFRLTANIIAGHLLVVLLSSALTQGSVLAAVIAFGAMLALLVLESAVSFIQAYVFFLLSVLYVNDFLSSSPPALSLHLNSSQ